MTNSEWAQAAALNRVFAGRLVEALRAIVWTVFFEPALVPKADYVWVHMFAPGVRLEGEAHRQMTDAMQAEREGWV